MATVENSKSWFDGAHRSIGLSLSEDFNLIPQINSFKVYQTVDSNLLSFENCTYAIINYKESDNSELHPNFVPLGLGVADANTLTPGYRLKESTLAELVWKDAADQMGLNLGEQHRDVESTFESHKNASVQDMWPNYVPFALWDDRFWWVMDADSVSLIANIANINMDHLRLTEQILKESNAEIQDQTEGRGRNDVKGFKTD